jgi:hypothetical protein
LADKERQLDERQLDEALDGKLSRDRDIDIRDDGSGGCGKAERIRTQAVADNVTETFSQQLAQSDPIVDLPHAGSVSTHHSINHYNIHPHLSHDHTESLLIEMQHLLHPFLQQNIRSANCSNYNNNNINNNNSNINHYNNDDDYNNDNEVNDITNKSVSDSNYNLNLKRFIF